MRKRGIYMQEDRERERRRRKRQQELRRKIFGFCMFTFLLGMLCGKIVFSKEVSAQTEGAEETETAEYLEPTGIVHASGVLETQQEPSGEDWKLVLVNAGHPVKEGYEPELAEIENNYYFDARAVKYLQQMLTDGRKEGLDFWVCSAYRTIEKQEELFQNKVARLEAEGMSYSRAYEEAGTVVAYPGTSEHNLGLAVDIVAKDYQMLDDKQAQTPEAKWLAKNCWKYGFILRYPTDKTEETGIIFEPWHYRYVGREAAEEIMEEGVCLEEYLKAL